ncbi:MAG TPA: hypothetical protein VEO54_02160 [Thermoanaerobaculia bacterium]|nr:hypothetical protein [Thermoanaerobaculia bacterium]
MKMQRIASLAAALLLLALTARGEQYTENFASYPPGVTTVRSGGVTITGGAVAHNPYWFLGGTYYRVNSNCNGAASSTMTITFDEPASNVKFLVGVGSWYPWIQGTDNFGGSVSFNLGCPDCNPPIFANPTNYQWPVNGVRTIHLSNRAVASNCWDFVIDSLSYDIPSKQGLVVRFGENPDAPNTTEPVPVTSSTKIRIPLGRVFSVRLKQRANDGTWKDMPSSFALGAGNVQGGAGFAHHTLFPEYPMFIYNKPWNPATRLFQSLRIGSAPLTITPTDPTVPPVTVTVFSNEPSSLGPPGSGNNNSWDARIWGQAHNRGIPPQYIKAIASHESNFNPRAWRYEPRADAFHVAPFRRDSTRPNSNYVLPAPQWDAGGFSLGRYLCPPSVNAGCGFGDIDDLKPKNRLHYMRNGQDSVIDPYATGEYITVREICEGRNGRTGWPCPAPSQSSVAVAPRGAGSVATNKTRPTPKPDVWKVVANPHLASSYGLMQTTWYSVTENHPTIDGDPVWDGTTVNGTRRVNPALLFDEPAANFSRGSASLIIGPDELRYQFKRKNATTAVNPDYETPADFAAAMREALIGYNGATAYADERVLPLVPKYLGIFNNVPIISNGGTGAGCTPTIDRQTTSVTVVPNGRATLSITSRDADQVHWYAGPFHDTSTLLTVNDFIEVTAPASGTAHYWARVSNGCGAVDVAATVTAVAACAPPQFVSLSDGDTVRRGTVVPLTIAAPGATSYQWYAIAGDGPPQAVEGETRATINARPQTTTDYVVLYGNGCQVNASPRTRITVLPCSDPVITVQPQDGSIVSGEGSAPLSLTATGTPVLDVVWHTTQGAVAGRGPSIEVSPAATTSYFATVTNSCGAVTSRTVTVTVCTKPAIVVQPADATVFEGDPAPLSLGASGSEPLQVQWFTADGALAATGNPASVTPSADTSYYAVVSNSCGEARSATFRVTIRTGCRPPAVVVPPSGDTITEGESTALSVTANGSAPLTVEWYTTGGAHVGSGPTIPIAPAQTTSYSATISNACGSVQSATVTIVVRPPCTPPAVVTQPVGTTIDRGDSAPLAVTASGTEPLTVAWFTGDGASVGHGPSIPVTPDRTTSYYATLTNDCGTARTATVTITVIQPCTAPSIATQPSGTTIAPGAGAPLSIAAGGTAPLSVAWFTSNGTPAGSGPSISVTPLQTTSYYAVVSNACGSVQSEAATITVCAPPRIDGASPGATTTPGVPVPISVDASGSAPLSIDWFTSAGIAAGSGATISVGPAETTTYYATVSNACGSVRGPDVTVTVTVPPPCDPPVITEHPQDQTVNAGELTFLSAAATGTNVTFQWLESTDGTHYTFTTKGDFIAVTPTETSWYYAIAMGDCGTEYTNVAVVTVR